VSDAEIRSLDRAFFDALLAADAAALRELVTDDFVIVDVGSGNVTPGSAFADAVGAKVVTFESIEAGESAVRRYGTAAIVVGSTRMAFRFGPDRIEVHSRYTHVAVQDRGRWRLASAQGTPIR